MNEPMQQRSDFKPEWKVDKALDRENVVVQVWKSNHRRPGFRISIGFKGREDKYVPSLTVFSDSGVVTTMDPSAIIVNLMSDALVYVTRQVEEAEAAFQASRPRQQGNEGRPGLKELGKKDRKDWESKGRPERRRG